MKIDEVLCFVLRANICSYFHSSFLHFFILSAAPPPELEDQDDDTEYNFYADHHEDEGEEFRTDRGVKIPRKCVYIVIAFFSKDFPFL